MNVIIIAIIGGVIGGIIGAIFFQIALVIVSYTLSFFGFIFESISNYIFERNMRKKKFLTLDEATERLKSETPLHEDDKNEK